MKYCPTKVWRYWQKLVTCMLVVVATGCVSAYEKSVGGDTEQVVSRIFISDLNTAWQSALEALKSYPLDVSNSEAGYIQTKWSDNTAQRNFVDSFANANVYQKAQLRYKVTASEGFYNGISSVKITVQKDQLVQRDVLEGWKPIVSDKIDENTLLYRIGRVIYLRTLIAQIEKERTEAALEAAGFGDADLDEESSDESEETQEETHEEDSGDLDVE